MVRALVCFRDHSSPWLALFRPGFRHCFAAVSDGDYWIEIDWMDGLLQIDVVASARFDLAGFYRSHAFTPVEIEIKGQAPRQPWMFGSCVGAVKRILGIRAPLVLTPYQLFRYLERNSHGFQLTEAARSAAAAAQDR